MLRYSFVILCLITLSPVSATERHALADYQLAYRLVNASIEAHGYADTIADRGGLTITMDGTFDLGARLQGRTLASESTPIHERISIEGDRLAYDVRWHNYTHSVQDLREIHEPGGQVLFIDNRNRSAGWLPNPPVRDIAARYSRYLPQLLLTEALTRRSTLRHEGWVRFDGRNVETVSFVTDTDETLTLYFDRRSKILVGAATVIDMPLLGDTSMHWTWEKYVEQAGLKLPTRLRSYLDGKLMKEVVMTVAFELSDDAFSTPDNIEVPPQPALATQDDSALSPQPILAIQDFIPYGQRLPVVESIAERVYLVRNLRPGFHPMFIEFDNYAVAIDAPAGWYEMQQIPPLNWSVGDNSGSLGEKFLNAIDQTLPGKPVRYLVLTHHHSDHIGGLRPFIAAGATVLASQSAATMAKRAVEADFTLADDRLEAIGAKLKLDIIDDELILSDGSQTVHLIQLPADNPKAEGYMAVYLPQQRLLYSTGFIYPIPRDVFPLVESIDLSRYFVNWLDASGLQVDTVYNVHGMAKVESWQLDYFRNYDPVATSAPPSPGSEPLPDTAASAQPDTASDDAAAPPDTNLNRQPETSSVPVPAPATPPEPMANGAVPKVATTPESGASDGDIDDVELEDEPGDVLEDEPEGDLEDGIEEEPEED